MLSSWYTRKELALRTAVLYSGLVLATAFSGLIAAGVFAGLEGKGGLAGWQVSFDNFERASEKEPVINWEQWLFIIEGAATFACALGSMFLLPDFPGSNTGGGKWLFTEEEQKLAMDRIQRDRVSVSEADESIMHGLKLAVTDYRTWIFVSQNFSAFLLWEAKHILMCT